MICRLCGKHVPKAATVVAVIGKTTRKDTGKITWGFGRVHRLCKLRGVLQKEYRELRRASRKKNKRRRKPKRRR